jgi:hypothetical protein
MLHIQGRGVGAAVWGMAAAQAVNDLLAPWSERELVAAQSEEHHS